MHKFIVEAEEVTNREYTVTATSEEEAREKVHALHRGEAVRGIALNPNTRNYLANTHVVGEITEPAPTSYVVKVDGGYLGRMLLSEPLHAVDFVFASVFPDAESARGAAAQFPGAVVRVRSEVPAV